MLRRFLLGLLASSAVAAPGRPGGALALDDEAAPTPAVRVEDVTVTEGGPGTLTLEPLATLTEHAWAWGSEAKPFRDGSRLYVPLGGRGLALYDVGNPRLPQLLAVVDTVVLGGQGGAVAASGSRAYVATPDQGSIVVLDVTQPTSPVVLARFASIPDRKSVV